MKLIITIISALFVQQAQASFLESCQFNMKVTQIEASSYRLTSQRPFTRKVTAVVTATQDAGGHISCDHHVGREYKMDLTSMSLADLAILSINNPIKVDYFHANSLTPEGVVESTSFTLVSLAQKAYDVAKADTQVQSQIRELQSKLKSPSQDPVVEMSASVQVLDEGLCGFAGCDSVHLIILTFGEDRMNSERETLLIKVYQSALGETSAVEIL